MAGEIIWSKDLQRMPQWAPRIVDKYEPREFSAISHNRGIVLCDKHEGAFIVLRSPEDVERLKALLATIDVTRLADNTSER